MCPRCFKPGVRICKRDVNLVVAKDVDCPTHGSSPEQTQPLPVSSPQTAAFVRRDRQAEAGGGSAQDQEWNVCGECAHQVSARANPCAPALGQFALGAPKWCWYWVFLVPPSFSAGLQGPHSRVSSSCAVQCCPTMDLSWGGTWTLKNSPAQLKMAPDSLLLFCTSGLGLTLL